MICAKVAQYAERIHHPDRLTRPLRAPARRAAGNSVRSPGTDALDRIADHFIADTAKHGSEAVWPFYYAGTMGLVSAMASTGCGMPRNIPVSSRQSASTRPGLALAPALESLPAPIRAK